MSLVAGLPLLTSKEPWGHSFPFSWDNTCLTAQLLGRELELEPSLFILSIPFSTKSPKNLVGLPYDTLQRVQTPGRELLVHGSLPSSCISVLAAKVIGKVPGGPGTH